MTEASTLNDALAANYMLVDFELRSWSGRQTDAAASSELITSKGAARDSGRFVKYLFASADQELTAVHQAGAALRHFVYRNSLPWSSNTDGAKRGERLIPAVKAIDFLTQLSNVKADYDRAVQILVSVWDERVQQAQASLGQLANPNDYPRADQVAARFGVSVDLRPVPSISDFSRVNVPPPLIEALGQRYAASEGKLVANAYDDLKGRILKEIQRMATQLGKAAAGEKTRLHETLNSNLQELVGMLRDMNITKKPELAALADKIEQQLLSVPVETFRNSQPKAAEVAKAAQSLAVEAAMEDVWSL